MVANWTVSHCETDSTYDGRFIQGVIYNKPGDTSYDLGNCPNNRRQIANDAHDRFKAALPMSRLLPPLVNEVLARVAPQAAMAQAA